MSWPLTASNFMWKKIGFCVARSKWDQYSPLKAWYGKSYNTPLPTLPAIPSRLGSCHLLQTVLPCSRREASFQKTPGIITAWHTQQILRKGNLFVPRWQVCFMCKFLVRGCFWEYIISTHWFVSQGQVLKRDKRCRNENLCPYSSSQIVEW